MSSAPHSEDEFDLILFRLENCKAMMSEVARQQPVWDLVFTLMNS